MEHKLNYRGNNFEDIKMQKSSGQISISNIKNFGRLVVYSALACFSTQFIQSFGNPIREVISDRFRNKTTVPVMEQLSAVTYKSNYDLIENFYKARTDAEKIDISEKISAVTKPRSDKLPIWLALVRIRMPEEAKANLAYAYVETLSGQESQSVKAEKYLMARNIGRSFNASRNAGAAVHTSNGNNASSTKPFSLSSTNAPAP